MKWNLHWWKLYFTEDWAVFVRDLALFCPFSIANSLVLRHTDSMHTNGFSQTSSIRGQWKKKTTKNKISKPQKCDDSNRKSVHRHSSKNLLYLSWFCVFQELGQKNSLWDKYIFTYFFNAKGITGIFLTWECKLYLFKIDPDGGEMYSKIKKKTKTYP